MEYMETMAASEVDCLWGFERGREESEAELDVEEKETEGELCGEFELYAVGGTSGCDECMLARRKKACAPLYIYI